MATWGKTLLLLLGVLPLWATPEHITRKVESALLIGDVERAMLEARAGIEAFSHDAVGYKLLVKSLSAAGKESEMLEAWEELSTKFPQVAQEDEVLEEIGWGILRRGWSGSHTPVRFIALLGIALTQDARSLSVLREAITDSNATVRTLGVHFASLYGDEPLREEIAAAFKSEEVWEVKQEIFEAIGQLKMVELKDDLTRFLMRRQSSQNEKEEAIKALCALHENVTREELKTLLESPFASLRLLGCALAKELELHQESDLLRPLLTDHLSVVREMALETWGILHLPLEPQIVALASSQEKSVAIKAGWVALLVEGEGRYLRPFFVDKDPKVRLLATAALAKSGVRGVALATEMLSQSDDPYVRANLALFLLTQRTCVPEAASVLHDFVRDHQEKLMFSEGFFRCLQKSTLSHHTMIVNICEKVDQATRLEILNLLAIVEHHQAQEGIKEFLKKRNWEVVGLAAKLLLAEGDETACACVQKLLSEDDPHLRLEAALLLASWGHDSACLPHLYEAYKGGDRDLKIRILEALGELGERESLPFLTTLFKEPSQTLRIIVAAVILHILTQ